MKTGKLLAIGTLLVATLGIALSKPFSRGETLALKKVEQKWGTTPFQVDTFKAGSIETRAKMAASLLKEKQQFIGVERTKIRDMLGDYSGYYVSGMYPTYLIQEISPTSEEAWQIVFLIDADGLVRDIVVHKNCCYR